MLRAIIFDFNGVVLNDEPYHYRSMRDAVAELGIALTEEEYYRLYLPLDDRRCLKAIAGQHSVEFSSEQMDRALSRKSSRYLELLSEGYPFCPGVREFIPKAAARYPLALASGARREEIASALSAAQLQVYFRVIVAGEEFVVGKPDPASYLQALETLNGSLNGPSAPIRPPECLVIEDSIGGITGARAAGMACLAVAGTYPASGLTSANRVVGSLEEVDIESLEQLTEGIR
jgi:beta-phosphoglucomutase